MHTRFFLLSIIFIYCSCTPGSSEKDNIIDSFSRSVSSSTSSLTQISKGNLLVLERRSNQYSTHEVATYWYPVAQKIHKLSDSINAVLSTFIKNENFSFQNCQYLYAQLDKYIYSILSLHPDIDSTFRKTLFYNKAFIDIDLGAEEFYNKYLKYSKNELIIAVISGLQNDFAVIENKIIFYCLLKTEPMDHNNFTTYASLVAQNTNVLKGGDVLEIMAGIGSFSHSAQPVVNINGNLIPLNEEGFSHYKLQSPKTPGNYQLPVIIRYFNQLTGKEDTLFYSIKYTVADTCRL